MDLFVYCLLNLMLALSYNVILVCPKRLTTGPGLLKEFLESKINDKPTHVVKNRQTVSEDEVVQAFRKVGLGEGVTRIPSTRYLLDVYQKLTKGEDLQNAAGYSARDSRLNGVDTLRGLRALVKPRRQKSVEVNFHLHIGSSHEHVQLAELRLRLPHLEGHRIRRGATVSVYKGTKLEGLIKYRLAEGVDAAKAYTALDLTSMLLDLSSKGYNNRNIKLTLKLRRLSSSRKRRSPKDRLNTATEQGAMIVVFAENSKFFKQIPKITETTEENSTERFKRETNRVRPRGRENCERKNFFVDFNSIGWGRWIVFPKRFNARQCLGRCPSPVDQKYYPTNHSILQSLMRLQDRANVARPCCVPAKLSAISMLYYEKGEVVVRQHEDMIVDKCGCR